MMRQLKDEKNDFISREKEKIVGNWKENYMTNSRS